MVEPDNARELIDKISTKFEEQWNQDQSVDFSAWLTEVAEDNRSELLQELLLVEFELRQANNLPVNPDSYAPLGKQAVQLAREFADQQEKSSTRKHSKSTAPDVVDLATVNGESGIPEDATLPPNTAKPAFVLRKIDNYELIRELKSGGMGSVFLARHHQFNDRYYAIKLVKAGLVSDEAMARFQHEINVAGQLKHENIVYSFDAGRAGNEPYLVMEFIQGFDLEHLVQQQGPLSIPNACELIRQAATGLQYAFDKSGLTHRDIKPANLMLASDDKVKILDLGLARLREQSQTQGFTSDGQMLGTPDYMAPEQWSESSNVTTTADIYSLVCSLYTLLTGKPPFYQKGKSSIAAKMSAHVLDPPPPIQSNRKNIPRGIIELVEKGLQKEPKDRFQTPQELVDALEPFCKEANLQEYKVSSAAAGPESYVSTKPLLDKTSNTVLGSQSAPSSAKKSAGLRVWVGIIVGMLACTLIYFFFINGNNSKKSSPEQANKNELENQKPDQVLPTRDQSNKTQVVGVRYGVDGDVVSQINQNEVGGQVVFEGESCRLEVLLPENRYLMVLAITPKQDDGKVVCIWPKDKSAPGNNQLAGFAYVPGELDFEELKIDFSKHDIERRDGRWRFSDGAGIHGFIVVSSKTELPSFEAIKSRLLEIEWPTQDQKVFPKHWTIQDDEAKQFKFTGRYDLRGLEDEEPFSFQPIVNQIKKVFENKAKVDGIVFNVEPHPNDQ